MATATQELIKTNKQILEHQLEAKNKQTNKILDLLTKKTILNKILIY